MACDLPSPPACQNDSDNAVIEEIVLRLHLQILKRRKKTRLQRCINYLASSGNKLLLINDYIYEKSLDGGIPTIFAALHRLHHTSALDDLHFTNLGVVQHQLTELGHEPTAQRNRPERPQAHISLAAHRKLDYGN